MKRILLLIALMLPLTLNAADLTLSWDSGADWPQDTIVRVYERTSGSPVLVGETFGLTKQVKISNVSPGVHKYFARAFSPLWKAESGDSNEVATPAMPGAPGNLKYTISITIGN
jgi:hypothetical protein